ncbi:hypothetical protein SLA2020_039010 [Shorea laevis]
MANRVATVESQVNGLNNQLLKLREELDRAQTEKESNILAIKEETKQVEKRARKAKAEKDNALKELNTV